MEYLSGILMEYLSGICMKDVWNIEKGLIGIHSETDWDVLKKRIYRDSTGVLLLGKTSILTLLCWDWDMVLERLIAKLTIDLFCLLVLLGLIGDYMGLCSKLYETF